MPIDLTDFTQIPHTFYRPVPESVSEPVIAQDTKKKVLSPIEPSLVDGEMQESLDREARKPTSTKKHLWSINDFEGVPYNEADAARMRSERGIPEPDELINKSEHLK